LKLERPAAGKTGTAQKIDATTKRYSPTKLIASFAGFAPASNPSIAMVVVVDEPVGSHHGGEVAAPIFKKIADQVLHYKGIAPDIQNFTPQLYVATPVKRESPRPRVRSESQELKIVSAKFNGSTPAKPYQPGDIAVPDFRGQSLRQIIAECWKIGLTTNSSGSGRASQQYPPAGARVSLGTVVEIRGTTYVCEDRTARKFNSRFDISCDKDTSCPYEVAGWAIVKVYQRVATEIIHPAVEIVRPAVRQADTTRIHHGLDGAPPRGRLAAAVREDRPEADGRQHAVTILRRIASTVFPQRHKPTSDDLGRFRRA
jgi:hypothetical protein